MFLPTPPRLWMLISTLKLYLHLHLNLLHATFTGVHISPGFESLSTQCMQVLDIHTYLEIYTCPAALRPCVLQVLQQPGRVRDAAVPVLHVL